MTSPAALGHTPATPPRVLLTIEEDQSGEVMAEVLRIVLEDAREHPEEER